MASTFTETLTEMLALHDKKNHDYGTVGDPFANVRASEDFGVDAWLGTIIRLNDKITRIKSFARNGNLENESLRDSLIDIAVYAAIALTLYDQLQEKVTPKVSYGAMAGKAIREWVDEKMIGHAAERIQHYPSKVAESLASYQCKGDCTDCTCNTVAENAKDICFDDCEPGCDCSQQPLCICGAGGVDIDCEAHGDIRCDATRYHLGEDRVCELRANHDGPHENWHTAAIHGTAPLQWAGKPEPVRGT
jgi:hypothetical protein